MSVANKGSYDLEAHINTVKHKKQIRGCHNTTKVSEFYIKQNSETEEWVIATERTLSFLVIKHNLYRSMDCTFKLNQVIPMTASVV
jgi:hypothetical protein